jgi:hypothetical protein
MQRGEKIAPAIPYILEKLYCFSKPVGSTIFS